MERSRALSRPHPLAPHRYLGHGLALFEYEPFDTRRKSWVPEAYLEQSEIWKSSSRVLEEQHKELESIDWIIQEAGGWVEESGIWMISSWVS